MTHPIIDIQNVMIYRYLFEMDKEYDFQILKIANLTLILQLKNFIKNQNSKIDI